MAACQNPLTATPEGAYHHFSKSVFRSILLHCAYRGAYRGQTKHENCMGGLHHAYRGAYRFQIPGHAYQRISAHSLTHMSCFCFFTFLLTHIPAHITSWGCHLAAGAYPVLNLPGGRRISSAYHAQVPLHQMRASRQEPTIAATGGPTHPKWFLTRFLTRPMCFLAQPGRLVTTPDGF